ncbi:MAG TPA: DUF6290 family protein [Rubrivivax sp.]|nr:DUF6290 family protein [Rubrivivax sp.]
MDLPAGRVFVIARAQGMNVHGGLQVQWVEPRALLPDKVTAGRSSKAGDSAGAWCLVGLYAIVIHPLEDVAVPTASAAVLSVRVNASERALLEAAAEQASTSLSDFVRRRALEAAESDLLNRRIVTIPAKDWARFEAWASVPAREVPALRKLSKIHPVWQK